MIAGTKRSRTGFNLSEEPALKRRRNNQFLSTIDRFISDFGGWLRWFFRGDYPARNEMMASPNHEIESESSMISLSNLSLNSQTEQQPKYPTHTQTLAQRNYPDRKYLRSISNKSTRNIPVSNGALSRGNAAAVPIASTPPLLESLKVQKDEMIFQQLLNSPSPDVAGSSRYRGNRSHDRPPVDKSDVKLYSVGFPKPAISLDRHRTPTTGEYTRPKLKTGLTALTMRDPSLTLSSSTFDKSDVVTPVRHHEKTQELSLTPRELMHSSNHITTNGFSTRSSSSSAVSEWLINFKEEMKDYQPKLETARRYAKILEEERRIADDQRALKYTAMLKDMKIRPWAPPLPDYKDTTEINLRLNDELNQMVDEVWNYGVDNKIYSQAYNIQVRGCDLLTLKGSEWLNDEIINFYLNLIVQTVNGLGNRKVHLFNSFFYPKIMSNGYSGVRRWTKKVDIFSFDLILLPVHLGMHWCMAAIDFIKKEINYYDSLNGDNRPCLTVLRDYLVCECQDKKQAYYDISDWKLKCVKGIPLQNNGSDCGVFACMYSRYLAKGKPFDFSQDDMPLIRKMMVAEIIKKQLL